MRSPPTTPMTPTSLTFPVSSHTITASHDHAAHFANISLSLPGGQTVRHRPPPNRFTSLVNPSTFGQSVTFTATVAGTGAGSGNPSSDGNVTFKADGTTIASCSNVAVNADRKSVG